MSDAKFKIKIDGSWSDWMEAEELRNYSFDECIMQETMTKAEYDKLYFYMPAISKSLDDAISDELANPPKDIMG